jgi:pimeloyl-ACP methyl ester carboxylesterase
VDGHARVLVSRWTRLAGWCLHARVSALPVPADAPTVVLVHGLLVSSRYMVPTAKRLAPYCRVHSPDLPGYGKSTKPGHVLTVPELADSLADYIRANRLGRVALLANSFGCQIAADCAARYPELVERLVLVGPTTDPRQRSLVQIATWLAIVPLEPLPLFFVVARDLLDVGPRRLLVMFWYMLEDRIEDKLPLIRVPTLVVRGALDTTVPQDWAETVTRLLPRAGLVVIRGRPHTLNYDAPEALERVVRPFLLAPSSADRAGPIG